MLQNLREKATGVIAFVIVGALVVSFALWGIQDYLHGGSDGITVAKVNGHKITEKQLNATVQRLRQQLIDQKVLTLPLTTEQQAELRKEALEQLVQLTVFADAATRSGYQVSNEQVNVTIASMPAFQVNGRFSATRFQQVLNALLYSQDQFINDLRQSMLVTQMSTGVTESVFVLPNEVSTFNRLLNQQRDFSYVQIPAKEFENQQKISDAQIKDYYNKNQDEFMLLPSVSIEYLELSLKDIEKNLKVTDQDLQNYYNNNIDLFSTPAKFKLTSLTVKLPANADAEQVTQVKQTVATIESKLKAGESFDKLASEYKKQPSVTVSDQTNDWVSLSDLPPLLSEVVKQLNVGQVSTAVQTDQGYEIVKLLEKQQAKVLPFANAKDKVKQALEQQKAQQIFSDQSDQLANLTYTNPTTLDSAAKALGLTVHTTGFFTHKGADSGIAANPKVVQSAFSDNVLKDRNNSDTIEVSNTDIVVIRVKDSKPERVKSLADVTPEIKQTLAKSNAKMQAEQLGEKIIAELGKGKTLAEIAKQNSLSVKTETGITRQDDKINAQVSNFVFNMPLPQAKQPSFAGFNLSNGDYIVAEVTKVVDDSKAISANSQDYQVMQNSLESAYSQMEYNAFSNSLKDQAKIKITADQQS